MCKRKKIIFHKFHAVYVMLTMKRNVAKNRMQETLQLGGMPMAQVDMSKSVGKTAL